MRGRIEIRFLAISLAVILFFLQSSVTAQASEGTLPNYDKETIVIDGYYDDWANLPKTKIDWDNQDNQNVLCHEGAILRKDNLLYVYMKSHIDYRKQVLEKSNLEIKTNLSSNGRQLKILPVDDKGNKLVESNPDLPNGIYKNYGVFVDSYKWPLAQNGVAPVGDMVAYTVKKDAKGKRTTGDAIEFIIDLERLAYAWDVNVDDITEISIKNHYLGERWIRAVGSPTYAVVFFLIALPMVIVGYRGYEKKKRGVE